MSSAIKSKILIAKAEAESYGITINKHTNGSIDYKDSVLMSLNTIEAYFSFTYSEMLGEFKRKIAKGKRASEQSHARTFMINTFV